MLRPSTSSFDESIQIEQDEDSDYFNSQEVNQQLSIWSSFQLSRSRLKTASSNSAFFAGFGIIAIVEVPLGTDDNHPLPNVLLYYIAISSILQCSLHLIILLIGNCIGPHIDAAAEYCELFSHELIELESPHLKMKFIIDSCWMVSTTIGTILFMIQLIAIVICKYWQYSGTGNPDYNDDLTELGNQGKLFGFVSSIFLIVTIVVAIVYFVYLHKSFSAFMRNRFKIKHDLAIKNV